MKPCALRSASKPRRAAEGLGLTKPPQDWPRAAGGTCDNLHEDCAWRTPDTDPWRPRPAPRSGERAPRPSRNPKPLSGKQMWPRRCTASQPCRRVQTESAQDLDLQPRTQTVVSIPGQHGLLWSDEAPAGATAVL